MTREPLIKALHNAKKNNLSIGECWILMDAAADMLEADAPKAKPNPRLNGRGGRRRNMPAATPAMSPDQVREARRLRVEARVPVKELALRYGVSRTTMVNALYGRGYYKGVA